MLEITWLDNEQMVSHKRSTTFSRVVKISLRKPRFRISFQICSIGFISGVYGGIWKRKMFFGSSNPWDLCHAAPSQQSKIISSGYCVSKRCSYTPYCNKAWRERIHYRSVAPRLRRHSDTPGYGGRAQWGGYLSRTSSISACWFAQIQLHPETLSGSSSPCA